MAAEDKKKVQSTQGACLQSNRIEWNDVVRPDVYYNVIHNYVTQLSMCNTLVINNTIT